MSGMHAATSRWVYQETNMQRDRDRKWQMKYSNERMRMAKSCLRTFLSWFVILDAAACMPDTSACISGCTTDMEEWRKDAFHLSCIQHICICMCDGCCDSLQACFSRRSCRTRCAGHKHDIACKLFFTRHVLFCKTTCTIFEIYIDL